MSKIPYKIYLTEDEMPTKWYNIRSDMKQKPAPLLNPGTGKPLTLEEMQPIFCTELIKQELDNDTKWVEIPEPVMNFYRMFRPSPLVHAEFLEPRYSTSSKATTPPAPTSLTAPLRRLTTLKHRALRASPPRLGQDSGAQLSRWPASISASTARCLW